MVPSEYGTARSSSTLKRLYPLQKGLYRLRMPTCSLPGCRDQAVVEHVCELVNAGGGDKSGTPATPQNQPTRADFFGIIGGT